MDSSLTSFSQQKFLRFMHIAGCIDVLFLLLINSILLYGYTMVYSFTFLMGIFVVSSLGLLQVKLLWTFICKSFVDICFHSSWALIPSHEVAESHSRFMLYFLNNCQTIGQSDLPLYIPPAIYENSSRSTSLQSLGMVTVF